MSDFTVVQAWSAATSTTHSFGSVPTPGNTLLLAINSAATVPTNSGWTLLASKVQSCATYLWAKTAGASEPQSVTVVPSVGGASTVVALAEFTGITTLTPDVTPATSSSGSVTNPLLTGTTAATTQNDTYAVAVFGTLFTAPNQGYVGSYTNSFTEQTAAVTALGSGTNVALTIAIHVNNITGAQSTQATNYGNIIETTPSGAKYCGMMVPLRINPPLAPIASQGWTLGGVSWGTS